MIKARASGSKDYLYFMKKGRQARHRIPRNSCFIFNLFILLFLFSIWICLRLRIPNMSAMCIFDVKEGYTVLKD